MLLKFWTHSQQYQVETFANLSKSLKSRIDHVQPVTKEESILVGLAEKCLVLSSKLQKDLRSDGGIRKVLKALWKKSSNKKRQEELFALEQAMQTQILATSWIQMRGIQAAQQDAFTDLDAQLKDFIIQVTTGHTKLENLVRAEAMISKEHTTIEADKLRDHLMDRLDQEAGKHEQSDRLKTLLASLAFPEMNARRNMSAIDAYPNTFQWVFDKDEKHVWDSFPSFLTSREQKVYWISGKPGSGKSTLVKFLIGHEKTQALLEQWCPNPLIISYFLWLRGSETQRSTEGLLASLLYQILDNSPDLFPANSFVWRKSFLADWSTQELEKALFQSSQILTRPICLFLDGLDELDQKESPFDLVELIGRFKQLDNFKICLASRPEKPFKTQYQAAPNMRLQDLTESDMDHIVRRELELYISTSHLSNDEKKVEALIKLIVGKAQGVFLWTRLVLRDLRTGIEVFQDGWDCLTKRVKKLPSDLSDRYRDMLSRLGTDIKIYQREAAFYFAHVLEGETNLFELSFADSQDVDAVINKGAPMPSLDDLNLECDRRQLRIEACSAGLLEVDKIVHPKMTDWEGMQWVRFQTDALGKSAEDAKGLARQLHKLSFRRNQGVHFIHRTAADFLLETSEGQDILACHRASSGQIRMNKLKTEVFSCLAGTRDASNDFLYLVNAISSSTEYLDQSQISKLFEYVDKIFFASLDNLEVLRGRTLQPTTQSLYSTARLMTIGYLRNADGPFVDQNWERYTKTVEMKGYHPSNDFKSYILFQALLVFGSGQRDILWTIDAHLNLILRLLTEGADAGDKTQKWQWTDYFGYGKVSYFYNQNLCALELFLYNMLRGNYKLKDQDRFLIPQQHAALVKGILHTMLIHGPDLKNKIVYVNPMQRFQATTAAARPIDHVS